MGKTHNHDGPRPALLETVFETSPEAILFHDADGRIGHVNERASQTLGYTREELTSMRVTDVEAAHTDDELRSLWRDLDADDRETVDGTHRREDGSTFPVEVSLRKTTVAGEVRFVAICRDVAEYERRETELARTRGGFDDIFQAVPHPLYVLDVEDYGIRRANSKATAQAGQTCYEVTHQRDRPCHEGDGATFPCPLRDVVETGEPTTVEHTHYDDEGNERVHEVHAAPVFDDEGTVVRLVESLIDVTDRKEYEQRLKEQRDNLDVLNQVLRHDVRNDLQLVTAYAEMLAECVEGDKQEYVQTVRESADHAIELTTTARDMADVMLTDEDVVQSVNLRTTLESELDEIRSTHPAALVTVDDNLPAVQVRASDMLDSVFRNLLKNAVQHNDKELPEVTVSTTVRADADAVVVRIADNGPGIPDGQKDEIFGKAETGLDSSGTGIGLYLVETLVENYGGAVRVEDNHPEGSVFVVELQTV
ncbi:MULTISPECIES: PAS domain S-box protein [Salinibaculum]|uniref:PAS domain S-box protein n=1 Tax=Salinibaculum TaxID=2732368 RepID=UPI0030CB4BC0